MIDDHGSDKPKHKLLKWVGLQAPPPDPESWVLVATGAVDNAGTGASDYASTIAKALGGKNIEARQHPYVVPDNTGLAAGAMPVSKSTVARVRVAVLVHRRDLDRARAVVDPSSPPEMDGNPVSEGEAALWISAGLGPTN